MLNNKLDMIIDNLEVKSVLISFSQINIEKLKGIEPKQELMDSIFLNGLINPVTLKEQDDGRFNVVSGRHRILACLKLGHNYIKSNIIQNSNCNLEYIQADENLIRENLSYLCLIECFQIKMKEFVELGKNKKDCFTETMAQMLKMSQRNIQRLKKIADSVNIDDIKQHVNADKLDDLNLKQLKLIADAVDDEARLSIYDKINHPEKNKTEKSKKVSKTLAVKYRIDYYTKKIVVNGEWVQLPEDLDMLSMSYNEMVKIAQNLINNPQYEVDGVEK